MFAPQLVALFWGDLGGTALWEEVWHWKQAGHSLCIFLVVKNIFCSGCHAYLSGCLVP